MFTQALTKSIFKTVANWWATSKIATAIKWTVAAVTIGSGVKGFLAARELLSRGQDILGQKTAQGGKIPVIYGRRRVGSTVVFMETAENRSVDLFMVFAIAAGEIDQIEGNTIELNGVPISDTKVFKNGFYVGSDKISSGAGSLNTVSQLGDQNTESSGGISGTSPTGRYRMVFNCHHGKDDQTADPMLTASLSSTWTSNHRLRGVAYIAGYFRYDKEGMFSGLPQLTVCVKGKKVYDPRKDGSITGGTGSHRLGTTSTYEWSENPSLTLLDYMTNDRYGKGLGSSVLNLQSFQTAANVADTLIDTPDFSGTPAAATISSTSGNQFFDVDNTTYSKLKIGAELTLVDSGGTTVLDQADIVDTQRFQPYEQASVTNRIHTSTAASSTLSSDVGTALVKVKRFTCNGVVNTDKSVLDNTVELLNNMRGILNYIDGKYELLIEDTASSSFTVTDDHIIDSITVNYEDKSTKYNRVVLQFFNGLKKYELDTVTVDHDASPNFTSDDGGEILETVVDFPFVVNKYIAYNLAEAILKRSRSNQTISFKAVPELYKVKVGDVITVAYTPLGYSGKLFRIEAMQLQPDGFIQIQAIEYLDIYTWQAPPQENIESFTALPTGFEVKAVSGLAFTDTGSSSTGRPFLSWTLPTDFPTYEFRVSIVDSSGNKLLNQLTDTNFVDLNFLKVGSNYVASVTSINGVRAESSAATLTFSVSNPPVVSADLTDALITTAKLVDGAATTVKLADDAVTNAKIATDAIQGDVVAAAAITNTKIADDSISTAKMQANSITAAKIAAGTVTATEIAAGTITSAKIAAGTIAASNIAAGTLTSASGVFGAISANDITAGTLNSNRLNTDTLQVKHFANVSADIIAHTGSGVPLSVFGSAFHRNGTDFTTQETSTGNFCPITIDDVRNGAKYQAIFTGVLGDNTGIFVEYSVDGGTTYVEAAGGIQDIDMAAGTFRTYVFVYSGTITGLSSSNDQVLWRLRFVTKHRSTYLSLYVFIDNTQ